MCLGCTGVGSAGAGVVAVTKVHAVFLATALSKRVVVVAGGGESVCCLLVLNSVTSTPQERVRGPPNRVQYSAYRARVRMGAGAGGLPSSFFALWATSRLLCRKAWV